MDVSDKKLNEIMDLARSTPVNAPSFIATRVLAQVPTQQPRNYAHIWRTISVAAFSLCVVLSVLLYRVSNRDDGFVASTMDPYVVRVAVDHLSNQVVEAEVILPDHLEFYSQSYPELSEERALRVNVKDVDSNFPFVVRSAQTGKKVIRVRFYNEKNEVVMEKNIKIDFNGGRI